MKCLDYTKRRIQLMFLLGLASTPQDNDYFNAKLWDMTHMMSNFQLKFLSGGLWLIFIRRLPIVILLRGLRGLFLQQWIISAILHKQLRLTPAWCSSLTNWGRKWKGVGEGERGRRRGKKSEERRRIRPLKFSRVLLTNVQVIVVHSFRPELKSARWGMKSGTTEADRALFGVRKAILRGQGGGRAVW